MENGPIVTAPSGRSMSLAGAARLEIMYVNKLAMAVVQEGEMTTEDSRSVMGNKVELDAKMRSATRVNLPRHWSR
jgi:hypothetical protein